MYFLSIYHQCMGSHGIVQIHQVWNQLHRGAINIPMGKVEIVKIKLPEDVTKMYSLENVKIRISDEVAPKVQEFIDTGFNELRVEFLKYIDDKGE